MQISIVHHLSLLCCMLMGMLVSDVQAQQNAQILQDAVDQAVATNASLLQLPDGDFVLGSEALRVDGAENLTVVGMNTKVIASTCDDSYLKIVNSGNVVVRGLTFDMNPLPFTQGTITAVSTDGQTLTLSIHDGYPSLAGEYVVKRFHVFSASEHRFKPGTPDVYLSSITPTENGRGGVAVSAVALNHSVAVGDRVVFNIRKRAGVHIQTSENITLDQVTLLTAPGLGFMGRFIRGDNRVTNCVIKPGPTPVGATQPRLLSTSADGLNFAYARQGPIVSNCDFSFMGDDSINLHGVTFPILQRESDTQVLVARPYGQESFDWLIQSGDKIRFMQSPAFQIVNNSNATNFEYVGPANEEQLEQIRQIWSPSKTKGSIYRLSFDKPATQGIGDFLDIPIISASQFQIVDNYFHDHRARGLRIMASDGLIARNRFERLKSAGISAGPEYEYWREAGWAENLVIDNNTLIQVGQGSDAVQSHAYVLGGISIFFRSELQLDNWPVNNSNIRITNNQIEDTQLAGIFVRAAQQVRIQNNQLVNVIPNPLPGAGSNYHLSVSQPIDVDQSCDVKTSDNTIE